MVLVQIQQITTANTLLQSTSGLATQLGKSLGVLCFVETDEQIATCENEIKSVFSFPDYQLIVQNRKKTTLVEICETYEASFLFIHLPVNQQKTVRKQLKSCRDLRIPYLFFKDTFSVLNLSKVMLPIGFLEEELEKAQFASAFGRFCGSEVKMLLANDYGSKAATNAEKMKSLFDKFSFTYSLVKATKDSFKVEQEAIQTAINEQVGLILVSTSRDYGLDDILFGPKEYHLVRKSSIPVLLINPRGDLYALCD